MTFIIENQFLWLFLKIRDKVRPGKGVTGTRDKTRQIRDDPGKYGTSGHPDLEFRYSLPTSGNVDYVISKSGAAKI